MNTRFYKHLNGLKLYGRTYQVMDSNLKFLRSLPKEWKPMTVSLRNSQEYKDYTLDRLYGVLKTYELKMEQDEKIEKSQKKGNSVAIVASSHVKNEDATLNATTSITEKSEDKSEVIKGKGKLLKVLVLVP